MNNTLDVEHEFSHRNVIRAEAKGKDCLVLSRLETPIKRADGKTATYELEHRWLSKEVTEQDTTPVVCVLGNDFTYWTKEEIADLSKSMETLRLFGMFDLF